MIPVIILAYYIYQHYYVDSFSNNTDVILNTLDKNDSFIVIV